MMLLWPLAASRSNRSQLRETKEGLGVPLGFSPTSFPDEARRESDFLKIPDAARAGLYLRRLTSEPHVAGTPGDRRVSQFIFDEFQRDGLNPELVRYNVLLSYPKSVSLEILPADGSQAIQLAHSEPPIAGDPDTHPSDPMATVPWNAYSPSADLTRPVIYANYGTAEDYDRLEKLGVLVKDRLVLVRYFHGYRGGKSLEAEKRGAAGVIVYSDPADDGSPKGRVYPDGPWGPLGHFQRGAVVYDFLVPGDPLTPGWASTDSAKRIPVSEAKILPKIPMIPLSAADAAELIRRLGGAAVSKDWQGGLPFTYRFGDGSLRAHLALKMESVVTPIWDVIGRIEGREEPDRLVILSNHHDAWVYGAVDPSSGTATMLETARAFGELLKEGFRPRRTMIFGSWDAEEYTLTGSTEWGEEHEATLRSNAVVCLNVDSAVSGEDFTVSAVPALIPALAEAARLVQDPATGSSIYERWKERGAAANIRSYGGTPAGQGPLPYGALGGGSDFMVFLQHDGVPSLDMIFDGPYGVYHSVYDDEQWMERYGDPGFRYHAAMSRLWGLVAMRFANADLVPLDYSATAGAVEVYLKDLEKSAPAIFYSRDIQPLVRQCEQWRKAAEGFESQIEALRRGTSHDVSGAAELERLNQRVILEERALLDDGGLNGRPWFRHLLYAPLPSYEAETLPGLREALLAGDRKLAEKEAKRLGRAFDRAIRALDAGSLSGK